MPIKPSTSHGFPSRIRIPRQRSVVHVLVKDGVPCDELVEVIIPAKTIGMRRAAAADELREPWQDRPVTRVCAPSV